MPKCKNGKGVIRRGSFVLYLNWFLSQFRQIILYKKGGRMSFEGMGKLRETWREIALGEILQRNREIFREIFGAIFVLRSIVMLLKC